MKKILLFFLFIFPAFAFSQATGQLRVGVVMYEHLKPRIDHEIHMATLIPNAKITAIDSITSDTLTGYTDENGGYVFEDVPAGIYYVKVEKEGFQTSNYYRVETDEPMFYHICLVPAIPNLGR